MFPRNEIPFEIVEFRMERKGDHTAPISKRKKNPSAAFCSHGANYPSDRTNFHLWRAAVADSAGSYFHAKFVHDFKVKVASQLLVDMTTIMADACDCSVRTV